MQKLSLYFLKFILLFSLPSFSQVQKIQRIADCFEVVNNDTLKIYFDCRGFLVNKECAHYVRIGKRDSLNINVTGPFVDYYHSGEVYFRGNMISNFLNGVGKYFYPNGVLMETGEYFLGRKGGRWTYYYPNGKIQKLVNHVQGFPFIINSYNPDGTAQVTNGLGVFKEVIKTCAEIEISGPIKGEVMDGEWTMKVLNPIEDIFVEEFKAGEFRHGSHRDSYKDQSAITNLFHKNSESVHLTQNVIGCSDSLFVTNNWTYKGFTLPHIFYKELRHKVGSRIKNLTEQWATVGLRVDKDNFIAQVTAWSSIGDHQLEEAIVDIISKTNSWGAAKVNYKSVSSYLFFTVIIFGNQIYIPIETASSWQERR